MSDEEIVTEIRNVVVDLGTVHGQRYGGIVTRSKYLNTENMEKVWQLVDQLSREQREARKNA